MIWKSYRVFERTIYERLIAKEDKKTRRVCKLISIAIPPVLVAMATSAAPPVGRL